MCGRSDQILQFQSLLFLGEVYLKDDKADLAIDRLNQCYFKIEVLLRNVKLALAPAVTFLCIIEKTNMVLTIN